MITAEPQVLLPKRFAHPEGIVWDEGRKRLLWVDVFEGHVHFYDLDSGDLETVDVGTVVGSVAPRRGGGYVCAVREGFGLLDQAGEFTLVSDQLRGEPHLQMNDGGVDARGRFWAGSMTFEFETKPGTGALYSLSPKLDVTEVLGGISVSNGIGWSPGSDRFYYVDSTTKRIDDYEFDLDAGVLGARRTLAEVDALPDGLAVDTDGCVWVALFQGSEVIRLTPGGKVDRTIRLPGTQVTTCTFGAPDLRTLFIAVSPNGLDPETEDAKRSGHIFSLETGAQGLPTHEFAG